MKHGKKCAIKNISSAVIVNRAFSVYMFRTFPGGQIPRKLLEVTATRSPSQLKIKTTIMMSSAEIQFFAFPFFAFSQNPKEFQSERSEMHKHENKPAAIAVFKAGEEVIFATRPSV